MRSQPIPPTPPGPAALALSRATLTICAALLPLAPARAGAPQQFTARAVAPRHYQVLHVGNLGGPTGNALDVDDRGFVVGAADSADGPRHAFVEFRGRILDLHGVGSPSSGGAWGVNGSSEIVGWRADPPNLAARATLWSAGETLDLGTLGGPTSEAYAIDAWGSIVGRADTAAGVGHAFLWDGEMHDLGTLGGSHAIAWDVNDSLQVVGSSFLAEPAEHAALWQFSYPTGGGTPLISVQDLGTLGGDHSAAFAVNAGGDVVGWSQTASGYYRAFLSTAGGATEGRSLQALDQPLDAVASKALDVNDRREIVGTVIHEPGGPGRAHHWNGLGQGVDLNERIDDAAGWYLIQANAINASGVIVGYGVYGGVFRGFALVPTDG